MELPVLQILVGFGFFTSAVVSVFFYLRSDSYKLASSAGQKQHGKHLNLPPGPKPWPVIGNLGNMVALDLPAPEAFAKLCKQYGPLMFLRFGSKPVIVASSPQMAREVLKTHDEVFSSRPQSTPNMEILYNCQSIGSSVYGRKWRDLRKVFTLELLTVKKVLQFQKVRQEEVIGLVQTMLQKSEEGKAVRLDIEVGTSLTRNIIRMMVSEKSFSGRSVINGMTQILKIMSSREFQANIKQLLRLIGVFHLGDYIPLLKIFDVQGNKRKMRAEHGKMDNFLKTLLADRRQQHQLQATKSGIVQHDFIDVLLSRSGGKVINPLDEDGIKGSMQDAILAGTDMITNTVDWGFSELLRHPGALKKAQGEMDAAVGRDRLVQEEDIPNLPYLQAIVKEVFRLHPVVPLLVPRESTQACEVAGYYIPAGCEVFVNAWAIARDPEIWGPKAHEFLPERFLPGHEACSTSREEMDVRGHSYELLPFGSGRRGCPGMNLGIVLTQYVMAVLIQSCDWSLPQGMAPDKIDMTEIFGASISRARPLPAIPASRLPRHVLFPGVIPPVC